MVINDKNVRKIEHKDDKAGSGTGTGTAPSTPKERTLYRSSSVRSQLGHDDGGAIALNEVHTLPNLKNGSSAGSVNGSFGAAGIRQRTASGKSVRSRTASRVEYHEDLKPSLQQGLTRNLVALSFVIVFGSSFLFGYNLGVLNQPVNLIKQFYNETYKERQYDFEKGMILFLWSLTTAIAFPGGMIGAYAAGFLADKVGRKRAIMISHVFAFVGAILSTCCVAARSPELLMIGRFFTGINCGFATQLAPMYLMEITPFNLRGAFGTANQLFTTIGILVGSIFGLTELLGTSTLWPYLLVLNVVPALISLIALPFFPDSPRYLMLIRKRRIAAENGTLFIDKILTWHLINNRQAVNLRMNN